MVLQLQGHPLCKHESSRSAFCRAGMHDLTDERSWSNKADKTRYRTECLGTEDARPFIRQHQLIPSSSGITRCAGQTPPPLSQGTSRIAAPTSWLHMRAGEKAGSHLPSCSPGSRWLLSLNEATPHLPQAPLPHEPLLHAVLLRAVQRGCSQCTRLFAAASDTATPNESSGWKLSAAQLCNCPS